MSTNPRDIRGFELLQTVLAQAVEDDDYRQRLQEDPKSVLREAGLDVPEDMELVIHENASDQVHLVLPSRRQAWEELDVEEVGLANLLECPF